MFTNKDIEVIRICLKTTLSITRGNTEEQKKQETIYEKH